MNLIVIKPLITEKSMSLAAVGRFTFAVSINSTKPQIAAEVAKIFSVKPVSVQTVTIKGKVQRSGKRRLESKSSPWKKAIVTLAPGQKIDLFDVTEGGQNKNA